MPTTTVKANRPGRPTLNDRDIARVFGELSLLTPRTPDYRKKRREFAVEFEYTERGIELLYERQRDAFLAKEKGRDPDRSAPLASPTKPRGSATPIVADAGNDQAQEV